MNDEAYLRTEALIARLERDLGVRGLGEETIAALAMRRRFDRGDDLEAKAPEPREPLPVSGRDRVLARLEALERHVLLLDCGVYIQARDTINAVLARPGAGRRSFGGRLEAVNVLRLRPGVYDREKFDLDELPDMSKPLAALRALVAHIREDLDDVG